MLNPAKECLRLIMKERNKCICSGFPNAEIKECFFHFGQAIWRHIQALGQQQRYQNEAEFVIGINFHLISNPLSYV